MTDILARLRVREQHGIRRFLYPLTVELDLPDTVFPAQMHCIALQDKDGQPVPVLLTSATGKNDRAQRLDFAVSLAPHEEMELFLIAGHEPLLVNDPIFCSTTDGGYRSVQSRFALTVGWNGMLRDVVYDGVEHLRGPLAIKRNGETQTGSLGGSLFGEDLLAAWQNSELVYADGCMAQTRTELTACKSWATVSHTLHQPKAGEVVTFTLPLAVTAPTLLYDLGVGGGIYGKLQSNTADKVEWRTEICNGGSPIRWMVFNNERIDYNGGVAKAEEYLPQRFFHLIDANKALAVAITHLPKTCRFIDITIKADGIVELAFHMLKASRDPATFSVCYHFLNDVPAIAAATNPQSILLPPRVDVL